MTGEAPPSPAGRPRVDFQFRALYRRELASYVHAPMSYLVWALYLLAEGYLFATSIRDGSPATMDGAFTTMALLLVFVAPLLTMRLVAEEVQQGTLETLLTDPVDEGAIVLAKYAAGLTFLALMLVPTAAYPAALAAIGQPDPGPILSGYVGLMLLGALFLAVGLLTSVVTAHQVAAAASCFTVLLVSWLLGRAGETLAPGRLRDGLEYMSAFGRFTAFRQGVLDTRSVVYVVTLTGVSLFAAARLLSLRRYR